MMLNTCSLSLGLTPLVSTIEIHDRDIVNFYFIDMNSL